MNEPIILVNHLSKHFGSDQTIVKAVDDINLEINAGEIVLITGPSGSGKTTLLSMLGGLLKPTAGEISIQGINISQAGEASLNRFRARHVGFIFQAFNLIEALSVEENILLPTKLIPETRKTARQRLTQLLKQLGLEKRRHALPGTLSGGEKQRVAIARALINEAPLILADEPTGNLDSHNGQEVMMILHDIARDKGCTILMVTHDPRVEEVADKILWLEDGQIRDRKADTHVYKRDPVCGMKVDAWTADLRFAFNSEDYVFCSRRCLERFKREPYIYLEQGVDKKK